MNTVEITPATAEGEQAVRQYIDDMKNDNIKKFGISKLRYRLFTRWANSLMNEEYNEKPLMITITQLKDATESVKEREQIKTNILNIFKKKYFIKDNDLVFNFVK